MEPLLNFVADGRDLLRGGVKLRGARGIKLRLRERGAVAGVLGVGLGHCLAVRHQLRLRQRGGLPVSEHNYKSVYYILSKYFDKNIPRKIGHK